MTARDLPGFVRSRKQIDWDRAIEDEKTLVIAQEGQHLAAFWCGSKRSSDTLAKAIRRRFPAKYIVCVCTLGPKDP